MPPRATASKTPDKVDTVSVVDALADDAAAVEQPTEYPPGAPALKPLLAIRPRSRRAEFKRRYAEIAEMKGEADKLQAQAAQLKQGSDARYAVELRMWAAMDDIYDKVDAALRIAAVDEDAYNVWSDGLEDDNDLMVTFNVYQSRTQPGEALSSTS